MPEILHRCVQKVMAKGHDEASAWAICRASLDMTEDAPDDKVAAAISTWEARQAALAEARIVEGRVIKRNGDGSGLVEVPITVETPLIDFSLTQGGGAKDGSLTLSDLQQMERNFGAYDAPVPVGFGSHDRDKGGASDAFMEGVSLRGSVLWARIWLSRDKFPEFDAGKWRAFSIEATKDKRRPASAYDGWTLTGGIFTNNPALPVNFKIAASAADPTQETFNLALEIRARHNEQESTMPADEVITLAAHQAKVEDNKRTLAVKDEQIEQLNMQLDAKTQEVARLRDENSTVSASERTVKAELAALKALQLTHEAQVATMRKAQEALQSKVVELSEKLNATETEALNTKVSKIITDAINGGVAPAIFDGHESGDADWMRAKFASLEAFTEFVAALRGVSKPIKTEPVKSGTEPAKSDSADETVQLTAEEKAIFDRLNIGSGEFVGITSEAEARKRFEAARAAKKGSN